MQKQDDGNVEELLIGGSRGILIQDLVLEQYEDLRPLRLPTLQLEDALARRPAKLGAGGVQDLEQRSPRIHRRRRRRTNDARLRLDDAAAADTLVTRRRRRVEQMRLRDVIDAKVDGLLDPAVEIFLLGIGDPRQDHRQHVANQHLTVRIHGRRLQLVGKVKVGGRGGKGGFVRRLRNKPRG